MQTVNYLFLYIYIYIYIYKIIIIIKITKNHRFGAFGRWFLYEFNKIYLYS